MMVRLEELKVLQEVPEGSEFRLHDGGLIKSITELYSMLPKMSPETFYFHVNSERNDFGSWVRGVQRDYELANRLNPMMKKKECLDAIAFRIYQLEKATDDVNKNFKRPDIPLFKKAQDITLPDLGQIHQGIIAERKAKLPDLKVLHEDIISKRETGRQKREEPVVKIEDPETAEAKIGLITDETGELILPAGGEDLVKDAEHKSETKVKVKEKMKEKMIRAKSIVDPKEFASDMKKVFTINTKKDHKKSRIDNLKRVLENDEE